MRGNAHPFSISLIMALSSAAEFSTKWDFLWFPLSIMPRWTLKGVPEYLIDFATIVMWYQYL